MFYPDHDYDDDNDFSTMLVEIPQGGFVMLCSL